MPYQKRTDLPESVAGVLPVHAEEIYMAAFNAALKTYHQEETARKVAWSAVKKVYKKGPIGVWVKRSS